MVLYPLRIHIKDIERVRSIQWVHIRIALHRLLRKGYIKSNDILDPRPIEAHLSNPNFVPTEMRVILYNAAESFTAYHDHLNKELTALDERLAMSAQLIRAAQMYLAEHKEQYERDKKDYTEIGTQNSVGRKAYTRYLEYSRQELKLAERKRTYRELLAQRLRDKESLDARIKEVALDGLMLYSAAQWCHCMTVQYDGGELSMDEDIWIADTREGMIVAEYSRRKVDPIRDCVECLKMCLQNYK